MLFLARNLELTTNREKTYLTQPVAVAGTALTVRAVDTNAWADNDYVIVGEIGTKTAELLQVNGAVSDGTTLTIDQLGSGGARYVHATGEPIYRIDYNQVEFSRNTTDTTSGNSVLATNEIQPDDLYTRYEDVSNTTGFGFIRFKNSAGGNFSSYSDGIPYTGYGAQSVGRMMRMVRRQLGDPDVKFITDEDIIEEFNEGQRDVAHERLWPFYEDIFSDSRVAYQREYDIDSDVVIAKPHTVTVESWPVAKIDAAEFDMLHWDSSTTGTNPTLCSIWNNKLRFYPTPSAAASTTTLSAAITTTTATTISLTSTSAFAPSGRILVDSEVISYTTKSSTQLLGCIRGLEETTAATHTNGTAVTERDIVYTANREPNEIIDINDQTLIPDPSVLVYRACMNLAIGKLTDQVLHDRFKLKFTEAIEKLRNKFGQKMTSSFTRIKDKSEVIGTGQLWRNPNNYRTLS